MDATTWNAYHIISNRARSVCYSIQQQRFRKQTEVAVNKLSESTLKQLHAVQELETKHQMIKDFTQESLQVRTVKLAADKALDCYYKQPQSKGFVIAASLQWFQLALAVYTADCRNLALIQNSKTLHNLYQVNCGSEIFAIFLQPAVSIKLLVVSIEGDRSSTVRNM